MSVLRLNTVSRQRGVRLSWCGSTSPRTGVYVRDVLLIHTGMSPAASHCLRTGREVASPTRFVPLDASGTSTPFECVRSYTPWSGRLRPTHYPTLKPYHVETGIVNPPNSLSFNRLAMGYSSIFQKPVKWASDHNMLWFRSRVQPEMQHVGVA